MIQIQDTTTVET